MAQPSIIKKLLDNITYCGQFFEDVIDLDRSAVSITDEGEYRLAWRNYQSRIDGGDYLKEYTHVKDNQQYSLRLKDPANGEYSFIQFKYYFDSNGVLQDESQIYYFPPVGFKGYYPEDFFDICRDEAACEILINSSSDSEGIIQVSNHTHLRIDYDISNEHPITHSRIHLHYGSINDFRITLNTFPTPFLFVNYIIQNFFRKYWEGIFFDQNSNFKKTLYADQVNKMAFITPDTSGNEEGFFLYHSNYS